MSYANSPDSNVTPQVPSCRIRDILDVVVGGDALSVRSWLLSGICNLTGLPRSGLALESLITILTPRFVPFFMILWVIGTAR